MLDCCFYSNLYCKGPIKIILRPPTISIPHSHDFPFVHSKICPQKYNSIKINGSRIFLLGFNTIYCQDCLDHPEASTHPINLPLPAHTAAPRRPTIPFQSMVPPISRTKSPKQLRNQTRDSHAYAAPSSPCPSSVPPQFKAWLRYRHGPPPPPPRLPFLLAGPCHYQGLCEMQMGRRERVRGEQDRKGQGQRMQGKRHIANRSAPKSRS